MHFIYFFFFGGGLFKNNYVQLAFMSDNLSVVIKLSSVKAMKFNITSSNRQQSSTKFGRLSKTRMITILSS